jgi:hypothetical protein
MRTAKHKHGLCRSVLTEQPELLIENEIMTALKAVACVCQNIRLTSNLNHEC